MQCVVNCIMFHGVNFSSNETKSLNYRATKKIKQSLVFRLTREQCDGLCSTKPTQLEPPTS